MADSNTSKWSKPKKVDKGHVNVLVSGQSPQFVEEWAKRGEALREEGQYEQAVVAFDRAVQLNPDRAVATTCCVRLAAARSGGAARVSLRHAAVSLSLDGGAPIGKTGLFSSSLRR